MTGKGQDSGLVPGVRYQGESREVISSSFSESNLSRDGALESDRRLF